MRFWELRVPGTPETVEALTNLLWELGALGVIEEESPGGPPALRAFYPEAASSARLARTLTEYRAALQALGFPMAAGEPEVRALLEEAWASAWQTSFPPRAIGERLLVVPPWAEGDGDDGGLMGVPGRLRIVIEPGRAFGTGHHGSTEGCLVLLDRALAAAVPTRVLDIGTGTGILAIAAAVLGAPEVLAVDVDPDAIRAVDENAARNACTSRVRATLGGPEVVRDAPAFGLVLANLLGPTHLALRDQYRRLLAPGATLVLGGMLADDEDPVREVFQAHGFIEAERVVVDGWSSISFRYRTTSTDTRLQKPAMAPHLT
jgi:ribosomal protein L11 methyltransferase